MKNLLSITFLLLSVLLYGQAPSKMNYQAIVRDASGNPVANGTQVVFHFTIHDLIPNGSSVFNEFDTVTANQFGLCATKIGNSNLATVSWGYGEKYLQVEAKISPASTFTDMGTSELLSVPYALHAKVAESLLVDTINNFTTKVSKGINPYYQIASTNEVYNNQTRQLAIVGATKDTHDPIDPNNDTRALMVHNDDVRKLTKAVVLEPAQVSITVLNDTAGFGIDPTLALFQMRDNTKEIIIGNSYNNPLQKNLIFLQEAATIQSFTADDGATYRAILFDDNGIQLIKNNTIMHKVDMNGNVTMGDVLNIKPRSTAPSSPIQGTIYFNSSTNKLMVYDSTTWQSCW